MQAILLAAGMGTRLKPITDHTPKCLVPINGKPLLEYWLEMIDGNDSVNDIFINLHYKKEQVSEYLDNCWSNSKKIHKHYENELQGTAGTLSNLKSKLSISPYLVVHADNLSDFDLDEFLAAHQNRPEDCLMTMMLFETDAPQTCGIVELDDNSRVINMHEKVDSPPGNLANAAVYIMEPEVLDWICDNPVDDISSQVIPEFTNKIYTWLNKGYHRDIGTPESYALAQKEFRL